MNIAKYREAELTKPVNPFFAILEPYLPAGGNALDLGCGTGKGAAWLANHGFTVHAIDSDPEMIAIAEEIHGDNPAVTFALADITDISFAKADVITAVFSLFFLPKDQMLETWQRIGDALNPGGVFGGQFIGPGDDWAKEGAATVTREELDGLLSGYEILHLDEVKRPGKTIWGEPKQWHAYHVIVRRS